MKAALVLAAVVALSGCTTVHDPADWTKTAVTMQQLTFDEVECERLSRDIPGTYDLIVGGIVDVPRIVIENGQREHIYSDCMRERGYEATGASRPSWRPRIFSRLLIPGQGAASG
jgi:hypothetical protein